MSSNTSAERTPFLFREIHKAAFLRWLPHEFINGKIKNVKKQNFQPKWTILCIHNGVHPYLEQYSTPTSPECISHQPLARICLMKTIHITSSIGAWPGEQYDFLLVTQSGAARLLAPDWNSMQDWVNTLRFKLRELKILDKAENVYGATPQAAPLRAPARDPHSPLPPAPALPADRIPGIEIPVALQRSNVASQIETNTSALSDNVILEENLTDDTNESQRQSNDYAAVSELISDQNHIETEFRSSSNIGSNSLDNLDFNTLLNTLPVTDAQLPVTGGLHKICGQNICLDGSILRRSVEDNDSDEDFFKALDEINNEIKSQVHITNEHQPNSVTVKVDNDLTRKDGYTNVDITKKFKNRVVISDPVPSTSSEALTNTQIPVMNTQIPVLNTHIPVMNTQIPVTGTVRDESSTSIPVTDEEFHPNVTVIELSNSSRTPPHTAIPVINKKTNIFNFDSDHEHVNIVTTDSVPTPAAVTMTAVTLTDDSCYNITGKTSSRCAGNVDSETNCINIRNGDGLSSITSLNNTNTSINTRNELVNLNYVTASTSKASPKVRRKFLESLSRPARKTSLPDTKSVQAALKQHQDTIYDFVYPVKNDLTANIRVGRTSDGNNTVNNICDFGGRNSDDSDDSDRVFGEIRCSDRNISDMRHKVNLISRKYNTSPKRSDSEEKCDTSKSKSTKTAALKRGLTELSFLFKGGLGYSKQKNAGTQQNGGEQTQTQNGRQFVSYANEVTMRNSRRDNTDRNIDSRRRSSSLSADNTRHPLTLRAQQVLQLRGELARNATILMRISRVDLKNDKPQFADAHGQIWITQWGRCGWICGGRVGDRVLRIRGSIPKSAAQANQLLNMHSHTADVEFNRIPLGKVYLLTRKTEDEPLGLKIDQRCRLLDGLISCGTGNWTLTEVNNRPIPLVNGYDQAMLYLNARGTEVSIVLQPTHFIERLRGSLIKLK